jgi:ribosome biogenesis GTPase
LNKLKIMEACVYRSTGSWYLVRNEQGDFLNARIKGKLKIDGITSTNPIAVGDRVIIETEPGQDDFVINEILERSNYINRVSPHNKNQHHIVAANLDQSLLFATLREPKTSLGFIDRFLVTCEAYHVPAVIVFNKTDVYRARENELLEHVRSIYESIGYRIFSISVAREEGLKELAQLLKDKTTLLSGHSGVGKSTFINYLLPELKIRTKEVSGWSGKGLHTTTFAEMYDLPFGGRVIDTPGIRELGLVDIPRQELSHYFPEMRRQLGDCQFNNCLHTEEPGCAVRSALEKGEISPERFISYVNILGSIDEKKY